MKTKRQIADNASDIRPRNNIIYDVTECAVSHALAETTPENASLFVIIISYQHYYFQYMDSLFAHRKRKLSIRPFEMWSK